MIQRTFLVCALVVLALELLALGHQPTPGPNTAQVERILAEELQAREGPVSDVRCVRRSPERADCVAIMYDGTRSFVVARVDGETERVTWQVEG